MAMEDTESCSSTAAEPTASPSKKNRYKLDIYNEVLRRIKDSPEAQHHGFDDELWKHFNRLPARYAIDVNVERAEHVLIHKKMLQEAVDPTKRPVFHVGPVQKAPMSPSVSHNVDMLSEEWPSGRFRSVHPPPMFGSSSNLEALAPEAKNSNLEGSVSNANLLFRAPMYEVTFASDDRPKLLNQLTSLLGDINLNIHEAHAFSTNDGYSLDVFVVEGRPYQTPEQLLEALQTEIQKIEKQPRPKPHSLPLMLEQAQTGDRSQPDHVRIPTDGTDVWEIDLKKLRIGDKVASGSYGDLYRGTYCSQDVAIKVLNPERLNADMQQEFAQEVFIMRKVRHKNVVQFIGACTKPPNLFIITEFMSGGSVYDYLHKHKGSFKLPALLRTAIDISKGMNYLHQNNIIHRDLKAANLLMDENQVIKVADFGVARVKAQSGVMTAETGTYRWMAPEVIEHKPYDHKADVFSFAIVLWELLTREIPYECYTPLQAAVGVVQKGLRPPIPKNAHPKLVQLLERCWQQNPNDRPDFSEILEMLQKIAKEVKDDPDERHKEKTSSGLFSAFRRNH